MDLNEYELAV